jgi:hypothetical protein
MRRAARRDSNHAEVRDYLRDMGWSVLDIADCGDGIPDLVASRANVGRPGYTCSLLEVKDGDKPPSARKLTPKEQQVKDGWEGNYIIATSPEQAAAELYVLWMQK